jgi:uncharacterized protein
MVRLFTALLISLFATASYAADAGPGFDCAKADYDIEDLICADDGLAALDRRLTKAYAAALNNYPKDELKGLKAMQRGWIKGRNDCWKADDQRACAEFSYNIRITELEITAGLQVVPSPVNYVCDGGPYDYLTAVFYRDTPVPAVVLTRVGGPGGDSQAIAFLQPTGSGAKYVGGNTVFWEHHGEAQLEINGKQAACELQ